MIKKKSHLSQPLHLSSGLLEHTLLILLRLSNTNNTRPVLFRLDSHLLEFLQFFLFLRRGLHFLRARRFLHLLPDLLVVEILGVDDGCLLIRLRRGSVLVFDVGGVFQRCGARSLCEVDRQGCGSILLVGLLDAHGNAGVIELEALEAVAPEMARAQVAAVQLAGIGQVEAGDGWEVF